MKLCQFHCHCLGDMLNLVALPGQQLIKRRLNKRADLKDGRRMVVGIDSLAVMDFLLNRKQRCADLCHTVGPVRIIMRKADEPSVIKLYLMGRPCIQGNFLHEFDVGFFCGICHSIRDLRRCINT